MATKKHETDARQAVIESLSRILADNYALYFQTQSFHWNVRGPHFAALHALFEQQYVELAAANDALAERLRALGARAPTSLLEITGRARIPLEPGAPAAAKMVEILKKAHEHLGRAAREGAELADQAGDVVTNDMLVGRAEIHDKTAWMLRATLEK